MAEYSFPVVEQPMSADGWRSVTLGVGNGILDQGGFPYRLTNFSNVDNTAVMKCPTVETKAYGHAILEGFYHRYDADITLSFPAVVSSTRYYVVLQYDPLNTTQPVALKVLTSLSYTQGKNYLHLYNVDRQPNQLLTDATVRMIRPRVAPIMVVASYDDLPQAQKSLWGTLAIVHGGRSSKAARMYIAMTGDDGESTTGWFWKLVYEQADPSWESLPDTENAVWAGEGHTKAIQRSGTSRKIRGAVKRSTTGAVYSEASGAGYKIATLSGVDLPAARQVFPVMFSGAVDTAKIGYLVASRTDAELRLYVSSGRAAVAYIPTIEYFAEVSA